MQAPFGDYLEAKIGKRPSPVLERLSPTYARFVKADTIEALTRAALELSGQIDHDLTRIQRALGGSVTPFSTFRGYFLEELAIRVAVVSLKGFKGAGVIVKKLGTGTGIPTGLLVKYRKGNLPEEVPLDLQRDREDVVIGFERRLSMPGDRGTVAKFDSEIIPVCIIACKMYVDATRLENILAKARSFYTSHAKSTFLVLAEWDALGGKWHDESGAVLDSLYAPVHQLIFLREGGRPKNEELRAESLKRPYRKESLIALHAAVKEALLSWGLGGQSAATQHP